MRRRALKTLTVVLALAGSGWLTGCLTLGKAYPDKTYYVLTAARPGPDPVVGDKTVLKIKKFQSLPRFEGRGLVYRTSDYRYESDYYHEWFLAPNAMLTQQVHDWLAGAGLFRHVLASASTVEETHQLEGTVTALYADLRDRAAPKAVLGLQVVLIGAGPDDTRVLMQHDYQHETDVPSSDPDALMRGWEAALQRILTSLEEDLKQSADSAGPGTPGKGGKGAASSPGSPPSAAGR